MPTTHKRFGGSTAERTDECQAWQQLADKMPPQGSSEFADRGTMLHTAMENILEHEEFDFFQEGFDYEFVIGMTYEGQTLDRELFDSKIVPAYEAAAEIFSHYGVDDYVCEQGVDMPGHDDIGGTSDLLASGTIADRKVALCLDWKFGDGKVVTAEDNRGGLFYSSLAEITPAVADLFEGVDLVVIAIVQPTSHSGEDYSVWEVKPYMLEGYRHDHLIAIEASKETGADKNPTAGKWCSFCPAEAVCPAKTGELQNLKRLDPALIATLPSFEEIASMESTLKNMKALVHEQLEEGVRIPGYKLVAKRASRVYADKAAVEKKIRDAKKVKIDECQEHKLLSPAKLEKVLKAKGIDYKDFVGDNVQTVSSGTTLAAEGDKRQAVIPGGALQALADKLS